MGLAVVIGIVKSHNGFITVDSTPGTGTMFDVYFPRITEETAGDNNEAGIFHQGGGKH